MKCPKKSELLRLQSLYKTDARIAEVLAVQEYLVAYWRRKKSLPRHSAPKFSRDQIEELWSRYGDDFRAGRELNISKAAFYSWRRKYEILERPAVLKLEQLELRLGGTPDATATPTITKPKTGSQKIIERCESEWPTAKLPVDWRIQLGRNATRSAVLCQGSTPVLPRGDFTPEPIPLTDIGEAIWLSDEFGQIEWQLIEARAILPGQYVIDPDQICAGLGGAGVLNLNGNAQESRHRVLRLELTRQLTGRVDVEDLVLALLARNVHEDWSGAIVELLGAPIERLSVDRKAKLSALIVHYGAAAALCPFDDVIRRHYGRQLRGRFPQSHPDRTATYDREHFIDGNGVQSLIARLPANGSVDVTPPPSHYKGGVVIGPAALPFEIEYTATMVTGRRIDSQQALLVCPATPAVMRLAQRRGWLETIATAGGSVLDVGLTRRLGADRLVDLAAGPSGEVHCTRPLTTTTSKTLVHMTSARTACDLLRFV